MEAFFTSLTPRNPSHTTPIVRHQANCATDWPMWRACDHIPYRFCLFTNVQ